jgi:DNA-binding transcriptional regulator YiaG
VTLTLKENLTMKELAEKLGIPMETLRCWESHRSSPAERYREKLVAYLGFDPDQEIK